MNNEQRPTNNDDNKLNEQWRR